MKKNNLKFNKIAERNKKYNWDSAKNNFNSRRNNIELQKMLLI